MQEKSPKDRGLFKKLHSTIVAKQLFLSPDLSRQELQTTIHVGKNRLVNMIQEEGHKSVTTYINGFRIEYSIKLMKKHPNHTIQSIATDSGISNVRTFYRVFKEVTGLTPRQYRLIHFK